MKTFAELNDAEKSEFEKIFYALWKEQLPFPDDRKWRNPFKFGRPWLWCGNSEFVPVGKFFAEQKQKIENLHNVLKSHWAEI